MRALLLQKWGARQARWDGFPEEAAMAITIPTVTIVAVADFFLYFSGVQGGRGATASSGVDDIAKGGKRLAPTDLPADVRAQRGLELIKLGWFGSVKNKAGINEAFNLMNGNSRYDAEVSRLVIYGHSAGAANALDLCRLLDTAKPEVKVDLLVTVDAAAQEKTDSINRNVADCVKRNINFWQDASSIASALSWSRGAKNTGKCNPDNREIKGKQKFVNLEGKTVEEEVSHSNIDQITWPAAVKAMNDALGIR
jgi:hypothetical protein